MKKRIIKIIDIEPTWESLLPVMLDLHTQSLHRKLIAHDTIEADKILISEFEKMARAADITRQRQKEIHSRVISVNDTQTNIGEFIKQDNEYLSDECIEMLRDMRPGEMITVGTKEYTVVRPNKI